MKQLTTNGVIFLEGKSELTKVMEEFLQEIEDENRQVKFI
jgi:hypothetical protein